MSATTPASRTTHAAKPVSHAARLTVAGGGADSLRPGMFGVDTGTRRRMTKGQGTMPAGGGVRAPQSAARVVLRVQLLQTLARHVSINGRRRDVRVTEQQL